MKNKNDDIKLGPSRLISPSADQGPVVYAITDGMKIESKMVFQNADQKIEIDFSKGKINVVGDWEEAAKNFLNIVEKTLKSRMQ